MSSDQARSDEDLESVDDSESRRRPSDDIDGGEYEPAYQDVIPGPQTEDPGQDRMEITRPESPVFNRELELEHVLEAVRLFQCHRCTKILKNPVTLPCGQSICRTCIPETHMRSSITYPAAPGRLQGFRCPFAECAKIHAVGDCGLDVVLRKVIELADKEIARAKAVALQLGMATGIGFRNPWDVAGVSSLQDIDPVYQVLEGGRLVATWSLTTDSGLVLDAEITYNDIATSASQEELPDVDVQTLRQMQAVLRTEMDCQVCYALLHEPFTTGCGHTFCRPCLHRSLDHTNKCPLCRRTLAINPPNNPAIRSNECVSRIIGMFWPQEKLAREEAYAAENAARDGDLDIPLFVCTLAFPAMPTFLHIFEPRYRLMIRRALDGNRIFGMVLPKIPENDNDTKFYEMGTLLRIVNVQYYPDGRSLIETIGLTRFRVVRHGELDGYVVAKTERIDDVSLEEEEAIEVAEVAAGPGSDSPSGESDMSLDGNVSGGSQVAEQTSQSSVEMEDADDNNSTHSNHSNHSNNSNSNNNSNDSNHDEENESQATASPQARITAEDLQTMTTQSLMRFATDFVRRMREQSVPWLTERMRGIYGECPTDPAFFPWWFASMLPVKDLEKYRLLATSSVRARLKICCIWILEWETSRW